MTNFKLMITSTGKHPASKWAELAADEIIEISDSAPETKVREAKDFREKLVALLTNHHQYMIDHEQEKIKAGRHDLNLPYDTEDYACEVVNEICALTQNYSFASHFAKPDVRENLGTVCNRNFKSAKLVERSHFHTERQLNTPKMGTRSKKL